ncbi:LutB/LldF family L-lactate oxidation iron-sulfur protein [Planomicrobium sp. CPCC 101110]|uniref:LutB/LldF family L-lactate oxidation iron-sulfur protein n=1 Tax=Planomicrobium sp. CPCC 101110 TaxID=2599619 RepID=UPI0011B80CF3|nr:LutB/LldF family L-lactate oxidation iron-sulfur protein [Planomicrobium sp. CPCC 101110]TWT27338.1 iron-sulfur cluster-binding protein [Planomicrobium sp. CPCC 101110]
MPMKIGEKPFFGRVDDALENNFMRTAMASAQDRLRGRKLDATVRDEQIGDWEEWRSAGEEIRRHTLENLDYYLEQLSENFSRKGGHVYFADTAEDATRYIQEVAKKKGAKKITKAKSMVTEEIGLNEALEEIGCEVFETDLAEYILQIDDHDRPSHIVVPSLHKNKEQIRDTFRDKAGYTGTEEPRELTAFARSQLREVFLQADIGITGCNFAVAESGTVSLVTNEGNANMVTTYPDTQISVMGMERLVPTWKELDVMVNLLSRSAVGQKITTYITNLTPQLTEDSVDAPKEFHLVILDAGRSNALGTEFQSALHCIRCAACVNVCPVYRQIGGHAYGSIYQGPIGAVLTPILGGYEEYGELPFASSLCAACTEACPVRIPLHEQLIRHRENYAAQKGRTGERLAMKAFGIGASTPALFQGAVKGLPAIMKPLAEDEGISSGPGPLKLWTAVRDFPAPGNGNFRSWFKNHKQEGDS